MSPRTSVRAAREASERSRRRSQERYRQWRRPGPWRGRRRWIVIGGTLLAGAVVGVVLANTDAVQDAIREVTLPLKHEDVIRQEARQHGVPPDLIAAVIFTESKFRDQTSSAGARGLMQITPETAAEIEEKSGGSTFELEDLSDPDLNIAYGTFWLGYLFDVYEGNEVAVLAAYNAGTGNVAEWGGVNLERDDIRFEETRDYVDRVLDKRQDYRENYGEELGL